MAYYRKRYRRSVKRYRSTGGKQYKRYRRRSGYRTRGSAVSSIVRRTVTNMAEKKYIDLPLALSISSTYSTQDITSPIVQGSGRDQRVGNKIRILKLFGHFTLTVGTGDSTNHLRFLVLRNRQSTPFSTGDLPGLDGNVDTDKWFVNFDKHYYVDSGLHQQIEATFSLGPWDMQYSAVNGTADSPVTVCIVSDSGSVPHPSAYGRLRVTYTDV